MIIDNIKNYLQDDKTNEFTSIINEIYLMTEHLNLTYPNYKEWFFDKQVKGCYTPNRNIIFIKNNNHIIGVSCLKKEENERKICTLFVDNNYRMKNIGNILLEKSFEFLETTKPLITFTEDKLPMFLKIIEKYDWQLTNIVESKYNNELKELYFNGQLTKKNYKQELIDILKQLREDYNKNLEYKDKKIK